MDQRQATILRAVIEEYAKTAEPVGSRILTELYGLDFSPATIRHEMSVLEAEGYLHQPHTSAGRLPTERGYAYYVSTFVQPKSSPRTIRILRQATTGANSREQILRSLARALVELSGEMVVAALGRHVVFTGISHIFEKPDFQDTEIIRSLIVSLERLDENGVSFLHGLADEPAVFLGSQNPFCQEAAVILVRCHFQKYQDGFLGILGPWRMDYQTNLGLLEDALVVINN